jgi:hypothetical protein
MNKTLTGRQFLEFARTACRPTTTIISDELPEYRVRNHHETEFLHLTIDHPLGRHSDHKGAHTNEIKSTWALIKSGLYEIYHHVSVKYSQNYVDEFCFKLNNRKSKNVFDTLLKQAIFSWQSLLRRMN